MEVTIEHGNPAIVHVCGQVDLSNSERLRSELLRASEDSPIGLVIDLAHVEYIDSAGIQAILSVYKSVRDRHGRIVLVIVAGPVNRIFNIVGLDSFPGFEITDNQETAGKMIRREAGLGAS